MKRLTETPAVELIEEATHRLRLAPGSALAFYYLGALPFVLGLLYFWSDMSRSAFAEQRLPSASLGLALLFVWMKTWQAVFAHQLLARLCGAPLPRWGFTRLLRVAVAQAILQPLGLILLPVAFVLTAPFPWIYAFYQNVTALGGSEEHSAGALLRKAWRQARLWTSQNFSVLMLAQLFGLIVFLNVVAALVGVPFMLDRFLGIPTVFTQSKWAVFNSTFLAAVLGLTYLCLDPWLKTIYVLRCFYGESLQSGADLKAELTSFPGAQKFAALALVFCVGLAPTTPLAAGELAEDAAPAQPALSRVPRSSQLAPPDLDRSINRVINDREFTWRLPRETVPTETKDTGLVAGLLQGITDGLTDAAKHLGHWIDDALRWLRKHLSPPRIKSKPTPGDWTEPIRALVILLLAALAGILAWWFIRVWQQRKAQTAQEIVAQPTPPVPDLADDNLGADQLPEDGWVKLARELWERGELRLALRALYLSSLAHLAGRNLITLARFKSNLDYERELNRRAHALPEVLDRFRQNVSVFDCVWYGLHEVSRDQLDQFAHNVERIKAC